ncbi:MAG: Smr/MutS family protein [Desulfovibrionaceae bacterium]|nr:Smr/MutS family protein [Desulfovibrionaceae bacterium]
MIHPRTLEALEFPKVVELLKGFCLSPQGQSLAAKVKPWPNMQVAQAQLALYEDSCVWAADPEARKAFSEVAFPDVAQLLAAVKRKHFAPDTDSFWALRSVLNLAHTAQAAITLPKGQEQWPNLWEMAQGIVFPRELYSALNRCISDDAQIKDESSPELYRLRGEMRSLHQNCLHKVHDYAAKYNILAYLQDEFMTISQDRYVLPLKATYKARLQGIVHDWSQTGETCYFEPMFLVELNNKLQELRREARAEEFKILDYLAGLLREQLPEVQKALKLLVTLDLLAAKRKLADLLQARTVDFGPREQGLELIAARHPLLAAAEALEEKANASMPAKHPVHPVEICFRPEDHCLLITGGNAGGKTVCLKTLGLIFVMAASGLPVPCAQGSHLFWFERVDAFIGDEQDLEDHVSTFTAQIEHMAKAWKYLHGPSLVLLDEFGAGTDPTHGAALAQAVLDALLDRGAYVLAATHFPTLKIWALSTKYVRAASMLFDPTSKKPLYALAYDQVGASQTLVVAKEHGLPDEIIARAEKYLLLSSEDTSAQLERLNALACEREEEVKKLKALQAKTAAEAHNAQAKLRRLREHLEEEVGGKIKELLKSYQADKATAKQTLAEMKRLRAELLQSKAQTQSAKETATPIEQIKVGQRVRHKALNKYAKVTDIDERKGRVRLDLGGIALWASPSELSVAATLDTEPLKNAANSQSINKYDGFALNLDVRGLTVDLALSEVQRFLDRMLVSGLSTVEIVHGRGTGVLRRELHEYLKNYPGIDHFELAPEDQGGDGKTVVYFR